MYTMSSIVSSLRLSNMGIQALDSHAGGDKQRRNFDKR